MIVIIIIGFFAVFFAWLKSIDKNNFGLLISFILIFIFLALRYNYGNDYQNYVNLFQRATFSKFIDYSINEGNSIVEPGWIFLNFLFKPIGFEALVVFTSLLYCICYYVFFVRYVPKNYYWLAMLIFIFDPTFLLIQLSSMRQTIAVLIVILSLKYIYSKKLAIFLIYIIFASLFHKSALFVLPIYFLGTWNWKINKFFPIIISIFYVWILLNINSLLPESNQFISLYFERYENYYEIQDIDTGLGFGPIYQAILFFLVLLYTNKQIEEDAFMFRLATVYFVFLPIGAAIIIATRINLYFQISLLVTYPLILNSIESTRIKSLVKLLIIVYAFNAFYKFMYDDIWTEGFLTYHTIFSLN